MRKVRRQESAAHCNCSPVKRSGKRLNRQDDSHRRGETVPICTFCRIVKKELPAKVLYEDDLCLAFEDINPKAPTHVLIVPKMHIESVDTLQDSDACALGHLFLVARDLARQKAIHLTGYRTVVNTGPQAGQSVFHIHVHLMGGRRMGWPPG